MRCKAPVKVKTVLESNRVALSSAWGIDANNSYILEHKSDNAAFCVGRFLVVKPKDGLLRSRGCEDGSARIASVAIVVLAGVPEDISMMARKLIPHIAIVMEVVDVCLNLGKTHDVKVTSEDQVRRAFVEQST